MEQRQHPPLTSDSSGSTGTISITFEASDNLGRVLQIDPDVNPTSDFYWMRVHYAQELNFQQ